MYGYSEEGRIWQEYKQGKAARRSVPAAMLGPERVVFRGGKQLPRRGENLDRGGDGAEAFRLRGLALVRLSRRLPVWLAFQPAFLEPEFPPELK